MAGEALLTATGETGLMPDGAEALYDGDGAGCDCCVDSIRVTLSGLQLCDGTYRDSTRADFDFYFAEENPFPQPCCHAVHVDGECEAGEEWIVSSAGLNGASFTLPRVTGDGANPQRWAGVFSGPSMLAVQRVFRIGAGTPVYFCGSLGPLDNAIANEFSSLQIDVSRRLRASLGVYEWTIDAHFLGGLSSIASQVFLRTLYTQPVAGAPTTFTVSGDGLASSCVLRTPFNGLQSHAVISGFSGLCNGCSLSYPPGFQDFYRRDDGGFAMRLSRGFGACTIEL